MLYYIKYFHIYVYIYIYLFNLIEEKANTRQYLFINLHDNSSQIIPVTLKIVFATLLKGGW